MTFLIQNFASQDHVGFVKKKKKIRATVLYLRNYSVDGANGQIILNDVAVYNIFRNNYIILKLIN